MKKTVHVPFWERTDLLTGKIEIMPGLLPGKKLTSTHVWDKVRKICAFQDLGTSIFCHLKINFLSMTILII
jgi:hypothetical protein